MLVLLTQSIPYTQEEEDEEAKDPEPSNKMLSLFTKSLAFLASLQSAAGMVVPNPHHKRDCSKRANGAVNAVYFVNWFVMPFWMKFTSAF